MKGFTLLEVMVALAIVAGVILTVVASFNYHLSVVSRDREETIAILVARAKLEDPEFISGEKKSGTFAPDWPGIGWETELTPSGIIPGVNKMTFTVNWDDKRKKLSLIKYLAPSSL